MTVQQFRELVEFHMGLHPAVRLGQAVFNTLHLHNPEAAEDLRCSGLDPLNNDDRVPAVIEWLLMSGALTV